MVYAILRHPILAHDTIIYCMGAIPSERSNMAYKRYGDDHLALQPPVDETAGHVICQNLGRGHLHTVRWDNERPDTCTVASSLPDRAFLIRC